VHRERARVRKINDNDPVWSTEKLKKILLPYETFFHPHNLSCHSIFLGVCVIYQRQRMLHKKCIERNSFDNCFLRATSASQSILLSLCINYSFKVRTHEIYHWKRLAAGRAWHAHGKSPKSFHASRGKVSHEDFLSPTVELIFQVIKVREGKTNVALSRRRLRRRGMSNAGKSRRMQKQSHE
jgi:hypothetical protein